MSCLKMVFKGMLILHCWSGDGRRGLTLISLSSLAEKAGAFTKQNSRRLAHYWESPLKTNWGTKFVKDLTRVKQRNLYLMTCLSHRRETYLYIYRFNDFNSWEDFTSSLDLTNFIKYFYIDFHYLCIEFYWLLLTFKVRN